MDDTEPIPAAGCHDDERGNENGDPAQMLRVDASLDRPEGWYVVTTYRRDSRSGGYGGDELRRPGRVVRRPLCDGRGDARNRRRSCERERDECDEVSNAAVHCPQRYRPPTIGRERRCGPDHPRDAYVET